jgi:hypothetical protein
MTTLNENNIRDFMDEYVRVIDALMVIERTLTPAEIDKREEIAKAIERSNPEIDMSKKMAIATAAAKRLGAAGKLEEKKPDYSAEKASAGEDIGKPGKQFDKISRSAAERYNSKEAGEKIAGAILKRLRQKNE